MRDSCEIRTLLNGSLILSLPMQSSAVLTYTQRTQPSFWTQGSTTPYLILANNSSSGENFASQIHKLSLSLPGKK